MSPGFTLRVSYPVRFSISSASIWANPASVRAWPNESTAVADMRRLSRYMLGKLEPPPPPPQSKTSCRMLPPIPSPTGTTSSISIGTSGTRITSAPRRQSRSVIAIHPASRPITSTHHHPVMRLRRSSAADPPPRSQIVTCRIEPETGVRAAFRSLSIVFGTPTHFTPLLANSSARLIDCVSSPPRAISASSLCASRTSRHRSKPPAIFFTLVRGRPQDRPAAMQNSAGCLEVQRHRSVIQHAAPAVHETHKLIAVVLHALADHRANYRV